MDYVPLKKLLHFHSDSVDVACQRVNLSKPGEIELVGKILRDWIQEQPHFRRKDFSDAYIKMTILTSKGSIERAKKQLDKMCTYRTLIPENFQDWDIRKDFGHAFEVSSLVILPKLTKDHHRVFLYKVWEHFKDASQISSNFKYSYIIAEYAKQCDFAYGYHIVIDLLNITNLLETVNKLNVVEFKQSLTLYMEAYGMKIIGIHILSNSKIIDVFVSILKQILKPKIVDRIHIYKTWEDLHEILGREIIPSEFGGHEKSLREIQEDWIDELSSKAFGDYLREMNSASTDESRRPSNKFTEDYAGMPGTFRVLSVD
ncbi:uncharacterized protein LOC119835523 [Zerene cesonia]|uniref:uncharacterized protein LOC119835523 n=1 Tax=Zerene cesonia TaxID=33412 RepID=UPI0018E56D6C|nr:uncharacterized protein LOC119835523 [Zerene cesonia]